MTRNTNVPRWKRYVSLHFLASKLQEKGVVWCFEMALRMIYRQVCRPGHSFITPLKQKKIFLTNLSNFISDRKPQKIILGVWDYKAVPWSVGDFLVFIETLSVLKLKGGADKVDVCVVCDSQNPEGNRGYANINPSNFRYYLFNLLPIINTCPYLGSVFQFDSRSEFYSFLKQNINKYEIYPPINEQLKETFNFYGGAPLKEIQDFYKERGFIPYSVINDYHLSYAYNLYRTKAKGLLPVVVSLRNRPDSKARNADRDAWLGFFDLCKSAFPEVIFVLIGIREEVFEEFRGQSNVIIAKDYGSTLADDFALMKTSLLYMSVETGVSLIVVFSDVPYLLFGRPPESGKGMGLKPDSNWEFATQYQKVFYTSFIITPHSLLREFSNLYNQLDVRQWHKKASVYKRPLLPYPTWSRE